MLCANEQLAENQIPTAEAGPDPELEQLPTPRHPWRKTTIFSLVLCLLVSITLLVQLRKELVFAGYSGHPTALGDLSIWRPDARQKDLWVQAEGELADHGGIRYRRPLDADSFRLVPIQGNMRIWVQVRVPAGYEDEHFVPPTTFVGRLMRADRLGMRYSALVDAVPDAGWPKGQIPTDAWVLIDGESPKAIRWVLALALVIMGFAVFCLWAAVYVVRPARLS